VPYFTRNVFADADLIAGLGQLHRSLEAGDDAFAEHERLIGVLGALFRRHGGGGGRIDAAPRDKELVARAVDLMRARCAEPLRLDDLASTIGLTPFQLIGLFKRTVGLTPHAFLVDVRLSLACRLLRRGSALVDAALAAGFCDQSALTKHFKRRYGITPLQFARAAAETRQQDARD
jgi:AraC-like DNA-binding protein